MGGQIQPLLAAKTSLMLGKGSWLFKISEGGPVIAMGHRHNTLIQKYADGALICRRCRLAGLDAFNKGNQVWVVMFVKRNALRINNKITVQWF